MQTLLTLNVGSSTLKFTYYGIEQGQPVIRCGGLVDGIGKPVGRFMSHVDGHTLRDEPFPASTHAHAIADVLALGHERDLQLAAVAHRVVHGGGDFASAVRLDADVLAKLHSLIPLAPLHQPGSLAGIAAVTAEAPHIPQFACFDTAFHATQDPLSTRFGIARHWHDEGVRRYSFHGLSYAAIAHKLPEVLGAEEAEKRVVVLHLGSGSSACVMHHRKSVATSMGMSACEGLMMGSRPGNLDPEVVLYWMENAGMDIAAVRQELYKKSGLLGVSGGLSADMRELLVSDEAAAQEAVELFCYRAAREVGALAVQAGGIDHLVFTAGMGERSAVVRHKIIERLAFLGFSLDEDANTANAARISRVGAERAVWVIPTDEEGQMAREAFALLG